MDDKILLSAEGYQRKMYLISLFVFPVYAISGYIHILTGLAAIIPNVGNANIAKDSNA